MGRLENFIPKMNKNVRLEGGGGVSILQVPDSDSIPVEEEVAPFLKQINGHMSLREIFLFLNDKGEKFSIDKSLMMLKHLASLKVLQNAADFYDTVNGAVPGKLNHLQSKTWDKSYFSSERLIALIQKTTLFLKCDRSTAQKILNVSELIQVNEGDKLIREGTKSDEFFVLLTGEVGVFKGAEFIATLGPLSVFGESAAIFNKVRNADVMASQTCWLLKIKASKIVDTSSPTSFEAYKGLKSRLILNQTLAANPLFRSLPTDVMQFFISKCRIEKYGKEQMVIEQGERSGDFYFVLQGSVSIIKDSMPVTSLAEGNYFGEVAAMFHEPRTASVLTETVCTFLVLNQKSLFEVLASHFRLAIDIEKTARQRKNSKSNLLQIFEEDYEPEETTVVTASELSESNISIDEDFFEVSQTNFDLELVDFSKEGHEDY